MDSLKVGQRIMVVHKNNYGNIGTIKYIGNVKDVDGTWYGVELDTATGKNDGTTKNVKYFSCKPSHGVFLKEHHFEKYTEGQKILSYEEYEKLHGGRKNRRGNDPTDQRKVPLSQQVKKQTNLTQKVLQKEKEKIQESKMQKEDKLKQVRQLQKEASDKQLKVATQQQQISQQQQQISQQQQQQQVSQQQQSSNSGNNQNIQKEEVQRLVGQQNVHELRDQINKQLYEIQTKDNKIFEGQQLIDTLNQRLAQTQSKVQELEQKVVQLNQKLEEKPKEDNVKDIEKLQQSLNMFIRKNQKLEEELKKQYSMNNNQNIVEKLTMDLNEKELAIQEKEELLGELQTEQIEIYKENEELQNQVQALKQQLEYQQQQQMGLEGLEDMDNEQLSEQNKKLRMALSILNNNLQEEKNNSQQKLHKYELALQCVPELQEKVKQMERIQKQNHQYEQQVNELKERVDENNDSDNMIEMMTREVVKKDEEIQSLTEIVRELKENKEIDQEIIDETEKMNKILQFEIDQKNTNEKILENRIDEILMKMAENSLNTDKYKQKIHEQNQQIEYLKEQLNSKDGDSSYQKIEEIQLKLQQQQQDNQVIYGKYIEQYEKYLVSIQEVQLANVYLKKLPKELLEKCQLNNFRQFLKVQNIMYRTQFMIKEVMEKYISLNSSSSYNNVNLQKWLSHHLIYSLDIVYYCELFVQFIKEKCNNEKYCEIVKRGLVFNQLTSINVLIQNQIQYMKEDKLSNKVSLEPYKLLVNKLGDSVMSIFRQNEQGLDSQECLMSNYKRLVGKAGLNIGVLLLRAMETAEDGQNKISFNKQVTDQLNKQNCRFRQLYQKACQKVVLFMECENNSMLQSQVDVGQQIEYLESIQELEEEINLKNISEKDLYDRLEQSQSINCVMSEKEEQILQYLRSDEYVFEENVVKGPWDEIMEQIREDLNKIINSQQEFIQNKEMIKQYEEQIQQTQMKSIENQRIQQELQKRVAELQLKAERVSLLENDKQRSTDQIRLLKETQSQLQGQLQQLQDENKELQNTISEIQQNQQYYTQKQSQPNIELEEDLDNDQENKYYKSICKKLLEDVARIKGMRLQEQLNKIDTDNQKVIMNSNNNHQQQNYQRQLRQKRQEMRILLASQKVVDLEQLGDNKQDFKQKSQSIIESNANQFEDLKIQTKLIVNQFNNEQLQKEIRHGVQILGKQKNVCKIGKIITQNMQTEQQLFANKDLLLGREQYSQIKDWVFNICY